MVHRTKVGQYVKLASESRTLFERHNENEGNKHRSVSMGVDSHVANQHDMLQINT